MRVTRDLWTKQLMSADSWIESTVMTEIMTDAASAAVHIEP